MRIRTNILLSVIFVVTGFVSQAQSNSPAFDKSVFYQVMASGKMGEINEEITVLAASAISNEEGYEGALLMRKAGLLKIPAEKLKFFKRGRIKLETALISNNNNTELHFLRLTIQEHAPKIVKYNKDMETDKAFIRANFKNLPPAVRQAIVDYSKGSKILSPQDLPTTP